MSLNKGNNKGDKNLRARDTANAQEGIGRLDGRTWLRYSISIWNDLVKTPAERRFGHPAMFPLALTDRLIRIFYRGRTGIILDPFLGSGSTVCSAYRFGIPSVGFELAPEFLEVARQRLAEIQGPAGAYPRLIQADSRRLLQYLEPASTGLCLTSPPYWNILQQRRSADGKAPRHYGNHAGDLGKIADYGEFLEALGEVFGQVWETLLPGAYCLVVVMDLRKGSKFYPFHMDFALLMNRLGYVLDDLVIWDRRQEYNNLRPLGYPHVFRINKIHEFILIFRKPPRPKGAGVPERNRDNCRWKRSRFLEEEEENGELC
ncbi:MAG: DNA methyltransferase [Bacillota bacterium]|nr:DNA methyltransferase [Bacillota bacterium]